MMSRIMSTFFVAVFVGSMSLGPLQAEDAATVQNVAAQEAEVTVAQKDTVKASNVLTDEREDEDMDERISSEDSSVDHRFNLDDEDEFDMDDED